MINYMLIYVEKKYKNGWVLLASNYQVAQRSYIARTLLQIRYGKVWGWHIWDWLQSNPLPIEDLFIYGKTHFNTALTYTKRYLVGREESRIQTI
jgi:hypothetical protein